MSEIKYWRNNSGDLHREDGPAIEYTDGSSSWYINGKLHRDDGPALDYSNGYKGWYKNGKCHRESGPAIEWTDGDKCWYKEGKLHRKDGPAIEYSNVKEWWINGKLHREDGPAREFVDGIKDYWLNGEQVKEEDLPMNKWPKYSVDEFENKIWKNEKGELHREDGPAMECLNGNKKWYKNGKLHRDNGPAIEFSDGSKEWRKNGERHRLDGPAYECINGYKSWWINGKIHREDGAACEYADGTKEYFLNGVKVEGKDLPMNKWPRCEIDDDGNKRWKNERGQYHREDGPAIEYKNGDKIWYKNGNRHREDGPAIEWASGIKEWFVEGKKHRLDGAACEYADGTKEYFLNGNKVEEEDLPMNAWPKCSIDSQGNKKWINKNGLYHREEKDGPAVERIDGNKLWYKNGELHREGGPACEYFNGIKYWYINGKNHREDGPAIEWANGSKSYYLNGNKVEEKDLPINKRRRESMLFFISSAGDFKEIENDCPAVCAEYGCYHYGIAKDFKKYTAVKIFKNGKWIDGQILNKKTCHLLLKVEGEDCELDLAKEVVGDLIASPKYSKYRFSLVSFVEVDGDK